MNCPRCKIELRKDEVKDKNTTHEFDHCDQCGGTWFDKGELSKIDHIMKPVNFEIRRIPKSIDQLAGLTCPSCESSPILQKAEHPRDKKVIIDYCPMCNGIWLDKGELDAIQKENVLITVGKLFKFLVKGE